jgi:hypothetical protein
MEFIKVMQYQYRNKNTIGREIRLKPKTNLSTLGIVGTLLVLIFAQLVLKALNGQSSKCLDTVHCVNHVGLHMRVLNGPNVHKFK